MTRAPLIVGVVALLVARGAAAVPVAARINDGERRPTGKEVQGHREETANVRVRAFRDPGAKGR